MYRKVYREIRELTFGKILYNVSEFGSTRQFVRAMIFSFLKKLLEHSQFFKLFKLIDPYFEKISPFQKRNGSREKILLTLITRSLPGSNVSFQQKLHYVSTSLRGFHELKLANSKLKENITMLSWSIVAGTISASFRDTWLIIRIKKLGLTRVIIRIM